MNVTGLGDPLGFEDIKAERASAGSPASHSMSWGFRHGKPITRKAAARLRKWTGIEA